MSELFDSFPPLPSLSSTQTWRRFSNDENTLQRDALVLWSQNLSTNVYWTNSGGVWHEYNLISLAIPLSIGYIIKNTNPMLCVAYK